MKKYSKVFLSLAVAAMFLPLFESCKKGEEDPGLSLKSRKGRVAGDWVLSIFEVTSSSTTTFEDPDEDVDGHTLETTSTTSESWDGSAYTRTETSTEVKDNNDSEEQEITASGGELTFENTIKDSNGSTTFTTEGTYTYSNSTTYTFGKDGTFSMSSAINTTTVFEQSEDPFDLTSTEIQDENSTITGRWSFIGKDKTGEYKNKERIGIWFDTNNSTDVSTSEDVYTDKDDDDFYDYEDDNIKTENTTTSTWTGMDSDPDMVWELIRLASDEMKATAWWTSNSNNNNEYKVITDDVTTTTNSESTTVSDWTMTMTLTAQ